MRHKRIATIHVFRSDNGRLFYGYYRNRYLVILGYFDQGDEVTRKLMSELAETDKA